MIEIIDTYLGDGTITNFERSGGVVLDHNLESINKYSNEKKLLLYNLNYRSSKEMNQVQEFMKENPSVNIFYTNCVLFRNL